MDKGISLNKSTQKHSVKQLSVPCIQPTEGKLTFDWVVLKHPFCRNCRWTFGAPRGLWSKKEYLQIKTTQKNSVKLLSVLSIQLTELKLTFDWAVLRLSFCRNCKLTFRALKGLIVEKGISLNKNYTELFCETSFCSVHSTNRVEAYFWLSSSETLFL